MESSTEDSFSIVQDPAVTSIPTTTTMKVDAAATVATKPPGDIPVKLLYSKSKVYVHTSCNTDGYIPGYISIVQKDTNEHLVAWTPENMILSKDMDAFVQVDSNPEDEKDVACAVMIPSLTHDMCELYAFSNRVQDIQSLVVHAPSITKWYGSIVINFRDGHSSAPLWFHDDESRSTMLQKNTQGGKFSANNHLRWGGDEFIDRLSQLVPLTQSKQDCKLYLVEKAAGKAEVASPTPSTGDSAAARQRHAPKPDTSLFDSAQMDPFVAALKEARWNILEKFSKVTKFSREAAVNVLSHPASKPIVPLLPPRLQSMCNNDAVRATIDDYDSARIYLAKWAASLAAQSDQAAPLERRYRHVGLWGHNDDSWEEQTALGAFEVLNASSENDASIPTHTRTGPMTADQWYGFFDPTGRLTVDAHYIRKLIFCGGLDPNVRAEAWLFLTDVYPWDSTKTDRERIAEEKRAKYKQLKAQWDTEQVRTLPEFMDQKHRIDKDVHRTDRTIPFYAKEDMPNPDPLMHVGTNAHLETLKEILCTYNVYNTDLGYVQGMSDLLSPLYAVIRDEGLVFAAFCGFMGRAKSNFYMDQTGMHQQLLTMDVLIQLMDPSLYKHLQRTDSFNLFFCFRWLLVWFKREFSWDDTLTLWEVLWTNYLTDHFHLFIALSILDQHRDVMIDYLQNFDEILKYINDLSNNIDLKETLQRAEILYYQFKQRVQAVDDKRAELKNQINDKEATEEDKRRAESQLNKVPTVSELLRRLIPDIEPVSNEKGKDDVPSRS